jgi:ribosomal protein S18 acetylase RimI-like enzyme
MVSGHTPSLRLRRMVAEDQSLLWDIFHVALWDPPPATLRPRSVLDQPTARIFAENWGRVGDVGLVALSEDVSVPMGGAWMRLLTNGAGLGYVDDETPQLGIALFAPYQRKGFGTPLMRGTLSAAKAYGYRQVALTVHPENPAIAMYEKSGFSKQGLRGTYHLMLARL